MIGHGYHAYVYHAMNEVGLMKIKFGIGIAIMHSFVRNMENTTILLAMMVQNIEW